MNYFRQLLTLLRSNINILSQNLPTDFHRDFFYRFVLYIFYLFVTIIFLLGIYEDSNLSSFHFFTIVANFFIISFLFYIIYVDNTLSYFMQLPFFLRSIFVINILEFSILYALILFLLKDYLIYNLIVFIIFFPLLIILYLKMITNIIYKIDIKFIPLDDFFYEIKIFIIGKKKDLIFTRRYDYELLLQFRARKERIPISRIYKLGYVLGFIYGLNFSFSFILFFPELILLIIALAASSTDFILFLLFIVFLLTCFAYKYRILEKDIIQDIFFIKRFSEVLSDDKDINLNIYNKLDFIIKRISKKGIEIGVWDNMKRIIKF